MLPRRADHPQPRASSRVRRNRAIAAAAVAVAVVLVAAVAGLARLGDGDQLAATGGPSTTVGPISSDSTGRAAGGVTDPTATTTLPDRAGTTTTSATAAGRPAGSGQPVTLAFGGDVHFEGQIRSRLEADPSAVLAGVAPLLRAADVAVVNLETAVTTRGTKAPGKEFAFRAPASAFAALKAGGVDVATMANNHGMDYGQQGLEDSLDAAAAAGVPVIGIGRSATEAYRPFVTEAKGQRIAVFGATQVLDDDLRVAWTATDSQPGLASAKDVARLTAAVRAVRAQVDTVVVYLHWGTEGDTCPNEVQPVLARALVEAGADVIVGGHAHRLQGAGRMGAAFVAYGLGNFVFYRDSGPGTESGVLTVTVTGRTIDRYEWAPARLSGQLPRLLQGAAADAALRSWEALRPCTGLSR